MSNDHVHPIFRPILKAIAPESSACAPLEGELCEGCGERAAAEWSWLRDVPKYAVMPPDDEYRQELRDAGRLP